MILMYTYSVVRIIIIWSIETSHDPACGVSPQTYTDVVFPIFNKRPDARILYVVKSNVEVEWQVREGVMIHWSYATIQCESTLETLYYPRC